MTPNKITTEMDAHLEAHPPHIEWTEGAGGIKHGTVIEEIPLPKPKPKKCACSPVSGPHPDCPDHGEVAAEPRYLETLDEDERTGH